MSDSDIGVRARNLQKLYRIYGRPLDRFREFLSGGRKRLHQEIWGLRDISFEVAHGKALGVVGSNGAGKSTLLKILCGTTLPSAGSFEVNGTISGLLELGTGFYPGFTGRQNIYLNATLMGFSPAEIEVKVPEIIDFSELGGAIDQPLRTYSSGMVMRLGFSVATAVDPDVLIIDEILAVGDLHFQKRCIDRIMSFRDAGKTILFCSHSLYHVDEICDEAIWIRDGEVADYGAARDVVRTYEGWERSRQASHGSLGRAAGFEDADGSESGSRKLVPEELARERARKPELPFVEDVRLFDPATGETPEEVQVLDDVVVEIDYEVLQDLPGLTLGLVVTRSDQLIVGALATSFSGLEIPAEKGRWRARALLKRLALLQGRYSIVAYLGDEHGLHVYHSKGLRSGRLHVNQGQHREMGVTYLDHEWEVGPAPRPARDEVGTTGGTTAGDG